MPIGRGIMQISRINVYPTASSFINISPASPASCGDTITFTVRVQNTRMPSIIPTGTASVIDIATGNILGSASLDGYGYAIITATPSNGVFNLAVKYAGVNNAFAASQSSTTPYYIYFNTSQTSIILPTPNSRYCPYQPNIIKSFVSLAGNPTIHPTSGLVQFRLYSDDTNFIPLSIGNIDGSGIATITLPAYTTGYPAYPGDGYYLQALFFGTGCYSPSNSASGTSGTKIIPYLADSTTTTVLVDNPVGGLCYSGITTATVHVTASLSAPPTDGYAQLFDSDSGTILGIGYVIDGYSTIEVDGYILPTAPSYPHQYDIRAHYFSNGTCYGNSTSAAGIPEALLTVNKYFATVDAPVLVGAPDACQSSIFTFNCQINFDTQPLDGSFRFDLYQVGTPDIFITSFGAQAIASPGNFTVNNSIPGGTMMWPNSYYVVGVYTPNGNNCYDTNIITSGHSLTLVPANC